MFIDNDLFNFIAWQRKLLGREDLGTDLHVFEIGKHDDFDRVALDRHDFFVNQFILSEQRCRQQCREDYEA